MPNELLTPEQTAKFIEYCCQIRDLLRKYCFGETFDEKISQLNRYYVREWLVGNDRHEFEMSMYNLRWKLYFLSP